MSGLVPSAFVELLLKTGELLQLDRRELLTAAQLGGAALANPDGGVRVETLDRLWTVIDERQPTPQFAPQAAQAATLIGPACIGVAGLIMTTCKNLTEMVPVAERYRPLIGLPLAPSIEIRPNRTVISFPTHRSRVAQLRSWNDAEALSALTFMKTFTGVAWRPLEVQLCHRGQRDRAYDEWFDCPIRFDCANTRVIFSADLAHHPFLPAPATFVSYLRKHGEQLLSRIDPRRPFLERVVEKLPHALRTKKKVAVDIAHDLGVSERTMQRYLRSEGTSFGEVLTQTRKRLAEQYLEDDNLPIAAIIELLGYSEAGAFYRAFRRWTGTTPAAYREERSKRPPRAV